MNNSIGLHEQKRSNRFKVNGGIFVALRPQTHSSRLGSLLDISKEGLSFQYPVNCNLCLKSFTELDIFVSGEGAYLNDLPIKIISDIAISTEDPFYSTTMKRFGVQFDDLSLKQTERIETFIFDHTAGFIADRRLKDDTAVDKKRRWYDNLHKDQKTKKSEDDRRSGDERRHPELVTLPNTYLRSNVSVP